MQSHPTLSRELVELFDNVSKQADEYIDMFNLLRRKARELDGTRTEMQQYLHSFRAECTDELAAHRQNMEQVLQELSDRIDFVQSVYEEMDGIHQLKEALQELRSSYHNRTVELDTVIHSIRTYLRKETETEFLAQEKKLALKIQNMESQLTSFDTRLYNTQDLHRREFMSISEEVNRFKNKITETKFIVDEATKIVNETVELADKNMNEKIRKYSVDIEAKMKTALDAMSAESTLKNKVDKLRVDVNNIEKKVGGSDQSINIRSALCLGMSAVALLISIIMMLNK